MLLLLLLLVFVLEDDDDDDDTITGGIFLTMADTMAGVEFEANGNDFGLK